MERNRTHIWKPLLHEVATGSLDANLDEVGYRSHCHRWGYRFFHGALESIDRKSRQITVAPLLDEDGSELIGRHSIRFDYLVLAVGSVTNDFSIHGVRENCLFLDDRAGADRFRDKLLNHCLRVSRARTADPESDAHVRVAIIGGGATGVELAADSTTRLEPCVITDSKYSMKSGSRSRWSKRGRASCRRFPIGSPRRRNMSSRRSAYAC